LAEARWIEVGYDEAGRKIIENKELLMSNSDDNNLLSGLSKAMADAVEKAGAGTVLLNARRRFPASGIAYEADLILTASHVIEREDEIPVILADGSELTGDLFRMLESGSWFWHWDDQPRKGFKPAWVWSARWRGQCIPGAADCWNVISAQMQFHIQVSPVGH
jgi:hypothetical protein